MLERLRRKASSPAWDSIVAGVLLQRDAGGDLPNLLRDLAATLETATRQEREAVAATAQARFTARIVLGLPLVAALLAELAKPGLLATLVTNPVSLLLTTFALTFQLVALITMAPDHAQRHPVTAVLAFLAAALATFALADLAAAPPRSAPRSPGLIARLGARTNLKATTGLAGRIQAAGLDRATHEIVALQAGLAILTTLTALPLVTAAPGRLGLALLLAAPVTGFALPELGLRRRADHRRRQIEAELPDVLDLLRVAIAAGLAPAPRARGGRPPPPRHARAGTHPLRRAHRSSANRSTAPSTTCSSGARPTPSHRSSPPSAAPSATAPHLQPTLHAQAAEARSQRAARRSEQAAKAAPKIQLVVALMLVPAVLLLIAAALVPSLGT